MDSGKLVHVATLSDLPSILPPLHGHQLPSTSDYTDTYVSMEDELTCPVCLELFADPLMLPCSHSICKKCLQDILASRKKSLQCEGFECPSCRERFNLTPEQSMNLPRNLSLENVVFRYQEIRSNMLAKSRSLDLALIRDRSSIDAPDNEVASVSDNEDDDSKSGDVYCDLCADATARRRAKFRCARCVVSYCGTCLDKYHPSIGTLAHHPVEAARGAVSERPTQMCRDHPQNDTTIFCQSCNVPACHLCVCEDVGKHVSHKIMDKESVARQIQKKVNDTNIDVATWCDKLSQQKSQLSILRTCTESMYKDATDDIRNQHKLFINDISSALEEFLKIQTNRVTQEKTGLISRINGLEEENEQSLQRLESFRETCEALVASQDSESLLNSVEDVTTMTTNLENLKESVKDSLKKTTEIINGQDLSRCAEDFTGRMRDIVHDMITTLSETDCPRVTPMFQTATSPGKPGTMNVKNKCLTTWGFKSSTFSANLLHSSSSWVTVIERNSTYLGDLNTGYLFGIGISSQSLSVKDLVGCDKLSYGITCDHGILYFARDGMQQELCTLTTLPLTVLLTVATKARQEYAILWYKVFNEDHSLSVTGCRLIYDKAISQMFRPVFSISQRVKMLLSF